MYSFNKTSHDANWREFKQPLFRKGKRNLLTLITRKTQQKFPPPSSLLSFDGSSVQPGNVGIALDGRRVQSADGFSRTPHPLVPHSLAPHSPPGDLAYSSSLLSSLHTHSTAVGGRNGVDAGGCVDSRVSALEERVRHLESLLFQVLYCTHSPPTQQQQQHPAVSLLMCIICISF
jgi:hypothetical protein